MIEGRRIAWHKRKARRSAGASSGLFGSGLTVGSLPAAKEQVRLYHNADLFQSKNLPTSSRSLEIGRIRIETPLIYSGLTGIGKVYVMQRGL